MKNNKKTDWTKFGPIVSELYKNGKTCKQINSELGINPGVLARWLKTQGLLRPISLRNKISSCRTNFELQQKYKDNKEEIINLYTNSEYTLQKLSDIYNISTNSIRTYLVNDSVKIRNKKERSDIVNGSKKYFYKNKLEILDLYVNKKYFMNDLLLKFPQLKKRSLSSLLYKEGVVRPSEETNRLSMKKFGSKGISSHEILFSNYLDTTNYNYESQYVINGFSHIYDFYIPEKNLIVEIDGEFWHRLGKFSSYPGFEKRHLKDKIKHDNAVKAGYNIIHITDKQIDKLGNIIFENIMKDN